jgi:hypothetical protein
MPKTNTMHTLKLSADELADVQKMAAEWEATKHAVLHLAVQKLIRDWRKGYKPKVGKKKITTDLQP